MKLSLALLLSAATATNAFVAQPSSSTRAAATASQLNALEKSIAADIREATDKNEVLEFGWDGTTALGGAVDNSKPARMLDEIRASGETQSDACELFNANLGKFSTLCKVLLVENNSKKKIFLVVSFE